MSFDDTYTLEDAGLSADANLHTTLLAALGRPVGSDPAFPSDPPCLWVRPSDTILQVEPFLDLSYQPIVEPEWRPGELEWLPIEPVPRPSELESNSNFDHWRYSAWLADQTFNEAAACVSVPENTFIHWRPASYDSASQVEQSHCQMRSHFPQEVTAVARTYQMHQYASGYINDGFQHPLVQSLGLKRAEFPSLEATQQVFDDKWSKMAASSKFQTKENLFPTSAHLTTKAEQIMRLDRHPDWKNVDHNLKPLEKFQLRHKWSFDEHNGYLYKKRTIEANNSLTKRDRELEEFQGELEEFMFNGDEPGTPDASISIPISAKTSTSTSPSTHASTNISPITIASTNTSASASVPINTKPDAPTATYQYLVPLEHAHALLLWAHSTNCAKGGGHLGRDRTFERIKTYFSPEGFPKDVINSWIQHCPTCDRGKTLKSPKKVLKRKRTIVE